MRTILVFAPYVPHPRSHGGSIRSRVLLDALRDEGAVHLAVPIVLADDRLRAAELAREAAIEVHELPGRGLENRGMAAKLGCWLRGQSELLARRWGAAGSVVHRLAQQLRPDLLVADSSFVLPVLPPHPALLLHLHNLEHSVFARDDGAARPMRARLARAVEARLVRAAERRAVQRARCTITVSDAERAAALAMAPGAHVVCVPNTVDVERLSPLPAAPTSGPVRLLFVGAMDYPPNLEAVRELVQQHLPALRRAFPGLVVRLVGRDPAGQLAAFRGVEGVEVVGTTDDLIPHYACSHAVYLPIRSGGGTRIKILEAWALGRPVLSTAVGAEAVAAQEGVHWRRFETPDDGVRVLRAVLADGGATMTRAARELVAQRFTHATAIAAIRAAVHSSFPRR